MIARATVPPVTRRPHPHGRSGVSLTKPPSAVVAAGQGNAAVPYVGRFTLSDMVSCGAALRRFGADARCMEDVAQRVVGYLYDELRDPATGERDCALVRLFKTHAYGRLPAPARRFAERAAGDASPGLATTCLTLLATRGDAPAWNDRAASTGHQAVPLPSEHIVSSFPMIAQLIGQFGLPVGSVIEPDPEVILELDEKAYNVFYVADAVGSPHIPAQGDFVLRYGIASVLGFGGMLPSGELFAVVMFARTAIPAETADLFRTLALAVKVALLPFVNGPIFAEELRDGDDDGTATAAWREPARTRTSVVEQLLEVQERVAAEQARHLEQAHEQQHRRAAQLLGLADAAIAINSSLSLDAIMHAVTEQARAIVGTHQSITSTTIDQNWAQAITAVSLSEQYAQWRDYDAPPDGSGIYALVCETNRPLRLTHAELESHPRWRGVGSEADRHPPMRGWLAAPLVSRDGRNLGLIQLSDKLDGDEFTAEDEAILVQLAQMASITIENARMFHHEHQVAVALQRSLLPQDLPQFRDVEVAARYFAGAAGVDVGGDWYDVFALRDGGIAMVLGDVAGRGIQAASVMGQLRMAVRAYALEEMTTTGVVERVDRLLQSLRLVEFATLAYAVWAPGSDMLRLVLAGHPPPLLVDPDGAVAIPPTVASVPLGAVADAVFEETTLRVEPGSTVLLYSDGLIESRTASLDVGMRRLERVVRDGPSALDALCDHVLAAVVDPDNADDATLLAVRLCADADAPPSPPGAGPS